MNTPLTVIITTYNRPELLEKLLQDIEAYSINFTINTLIFDDGSSKNYTQIIANFKEKLKIKYFKSTKNHGKRQYWKLVSKAFQTLKMSKSKYFIMLPDDVRLSSNFFDESVSTWEAINDEKKNMLIITFT